jgi:hypothetical protein
MASWTSKSIYFSYFSPIFKETTSNTLAWGVVYLILNQDVQKKLHEELDKIVGSSRLVTLEDRSKLPYTAAIVNVKPRKKDF